MRKRIPSGNSCCCFSIVKEADLETLFRKYSLKTLNQQGRVRSGSIPEFVKDSDTVSTEKGTGPKTHNSPFSAMNISLPAGDFTRNDGVADASSPNEGGGLGLSNEEDSTEDTTDHFPKIGTFPRYFPNPSNFVNDAETVPSPNTSKNSNKRYAMRIPNTILRQGKASSGHANYTVAVP